MVAQLYHKFTLPTNLLDARLDGEFANLYSYITGALAIPLSIASGGTNSITALNNNRVMQSSAGAIVEAAAITAARALISDVNGIPTQSAVTSTTLAFLDATSSVQTQLNGKQATGSYVTALTGDVAATGPGSVAATLATVNVSPGATTLSSVTTNGKGLVTANSSATTTGSGSVALATSPVLVTPLLGTPTSGVLTNCTGTAAGLTSGTVTTNANLTGPITSSGNATAIASQTGTGTKFVVDTSPVLVTPNIGTPSAGTLTNCTGLPVAGVSAVAWTSSFTPVVTAQAGTLTTTSAACRYQQIGKTVCITMIVTITNHGTAIGNVILSLPVTSNTSLAFQFLYGAETAVNGKTVRGVLSGTTAPISYYDNSATAVLDGVTFYISGTYEAA